MKAKVHPYHIIEVDCPDCKGSGERAYHLGPIGKKGYRVRPCPECYKSKNKGKRRMAVWLPKENCFPSPKGGFSIEGVYYSRKQFNEIAHLFSNYVKNATLPNGERIGKVELEQAGLVMTLENRELLGNIGICGSDTWLCTALVQEVAE